MVKFSVGDKVRYISERRFEEGAVLYIVEYDGGTIMPYSLSPNPEDSSGSKDALWVNEDEFELVKEDVNMGRADTKYKTEKRKANVGERILITDAGMSFGDYGNGDVFTVEKHFYGFISEGVCVRELPKDGVGNSLQIYEEEYEVITEESSPSTHNENLVLTRLFNAEAEVDRMSRSIDELKRKIETLEKEKADKPKFVGINLREEIAKSPTRTANQRRADVIKRAESFVEDLRKDTVLTKMTFHTNAEKGVVTALCHSKASGILLEKAFARCAPGDVFNDKIGMAIAAGRLYGVTIPEEFTDAPQPTEVVVGQTFKVTQEGPITGVTAEVTRVALKSSSEYKRRYGQAFYHTHDSGWLGQDQVEIIDDSKAEYV